MKSHHDLLLLLREIESKASKDFSGLGLVWYEILNDLPFASLKRMDDEVFLPIMSKSQIIDFLVKTSTLTNRYHDGFHFLNKNMELTHISQYISPPILKNIDINTEHGSRYRTALYTSAIPGIIACGVLSNNYTPTIFIGGKEL